MPTLHIFNPEHDIALATHLANFTPPKAGRELRRDLGWLPLLWASPGDYILVDGPQEVPPFVRADGVELLTWQQFRRTPVRVSAVEPWGWDRAVAGQLRRSGLSALTPDDDRLDRIRRMSHRGFAARHFLPRLVALDARLVGQAVETQTLAPTIPCVLKAPWSSSGRGIRYVGSPDDWLRQAAWARNVIAAQGSIMVEPLYRRVRDFGMEFIIRNGQTRYLGLSLFETVHGAYTGNLVALEQEKLRCLGDCFKEFRSSGVQEFRELLTRVQREVEAIADEQIGPFYSGPFGIDMMIVETREGLRLHPCVELNLRRTMGHVALSSALPRGHMLIDYDGRYHLRTVAAQGADGR